MSIYAFLAHNSSISFLKKRVNTEGPFPLFLYKLLSKKRDNSLRATPFFISIKNNISLLNDLLTIYDQQLRDQNIAVFIPNC
jgi:hypothetical protein